MEKKKIAAAMAVVEYITQESLANMERAKVSEPTLWTAYARQTVMQNRSMLQRRQIKR